ncbi:MAG: MnhB domain-containing protein [Pseudomonadota bacterium]
MTSPILKAAARVLVALMLVVSLYLLVRGHNEPGGGFIGGLIAAAAFAVLAVSHGTATARQALRLDPIEVLAIGVGAALLAGLMAGLGGSAPFTGLWLLLGADGGGKGLPLSTVLLFDVGVWLTVIGTVTALVFALEEEDEGPEGDGAANAPKENR